ncbi:MAG: hypothetical protein ACRDJW_10555 [Thermomicrobiales bacterium]
MRRIALHTMAFALAAVCILAARAGAAAAPPEPRAVAIPCVTNVSAQVLGSTPAPNAEGQVLVLARVILAPGGSIGAHTHPGTLIVSVESGTFELTLLDHGEMAVMRSGAAGTPAASEPITHGQEVELAPGDWFVEVGMIHSSRAIGDEPAVVVLTGLIVAGQPLTQCVEGTPTP